MLRNLSTTLRRIAAALALVALALTGTVVSASSASAESPSLPSSYVEGTDKQAALFDPVVVNRADITLSAQGYNNLQANGRGDYQAAQMVFTTKNGPSAKLEVGLRLKGQWGSWRTLDQKAAFKVKMNFSVKGQKLDGVKKFTFNNMVQDQSMLHEATVYRIFRAMGVPAPRIGYVRVYLNGVDYGLHLNVESYDDQMLERWYSSTQHLYEGAYWQDIVDGQYQNMEIDEGDLNNREDLAALALVNNTKNGQEWFEAVQQYLDLNSFVKEIAVERYIGHWDGYGWTIKNNYYAHSTQNGLFTILPWGTDQTLNGWVDMYSYGDVGIMAQKCLAYTPCLELYKGAMLKVNDTVLSLGLTTMIDKIAAAINPDVLSDPRKEHDYGTALWLQESSKNHINWVTGFIPGQVNASNAQGITAWEHSSAVALSYPLGSTSVGKKLNPTVTRAGGNGTLRYRVVAGTENCSVNAVSGVVTVLAVKYCRVSVSAATDGSWAPSINYAELMDARKDGLVIIDPIEGAKYGALTEVSFTSKSSSPSVVSATGPCKIVKKVFISPTSGTGTCTITVSAPADTTHLEAMAEQDVTLALGDGVAKKLTKNASFIGDLPSGGSIVLNQVASQVSGNCSQIGNRLYAGAASGTCSVTFDESQDEYLSYPAKTFTVRMVSSAQAFVGSFGTSGNRKIGSTRYVLARQGTQLTTLNASATWTASAGCLLIQEQTRVLVKLKGRSSCQVTLRSVTIFGLPTLVKTWNLNF